MVMWGDREGKDELNTCAALLYATDESVASLPVVFCVKARGHLSTHSVLSYVGEL